MKLFGPAKGSGYLVWLVLMSACGGTSEADGRSRDSGANSANSERSGGSGAQAGQFPGSGGLLAAVGTPATAPARSGGRGGEAQGADESSVTRGAATAGAADLGSGGSAGSIELTRDPGPGSTAGNSATGGGAAGPPLAGTAGGTLATGGLGPSGGVSTPGGGSAGSPIGSGGTGPQSTATRLDLLLVIDNSLSMGDKQQLLVRPVPELVGHLINPPCVDSAGVVVDEPATPSAACARGRRERAPLTDLHLGVITSSLGAAGTSCTPHFTIPMEDDRGELIAPLRGAPHDGQGFLVFGPGTDYQSFLDRVAAQVQAAGENGCGYESTHEAWYRFLIDPEPPARVEVDKSRQITVCSGVNQTVLEQRRAFLRPDSALAIVVLSDENDCSLLDNGQAWLVAYSGRLPRPTAACEVDPNSVCCRSCAMGEDAPPPGCVPLGEDTSCLLDAGEGRGFLSLAEDYPNLRCWQTRRRFGFDLLQPVQRYVDALTLRTVRGRDGGPVPNPLFAEGRDPSLVTLVGIVGVPWQDLARDPEAPGQLELLGPGELEERWTAILGDPESLVPPGDPFMIESIDPRSGNNPFTGAPIVGPDSLDPGATINGHECRADQPTMRDELQYACIFPLAEPRDCSGPEYGPDVPVEQRKACDCVPSALDRNRPLCQPPGGGAAGTTQYFTKAYPGIRHLEILRGLGPRAIVGSICPRQTSDPAAPDYGYRPVIRALAARLSLMLR